MNWVRVLIACLLLVAAPLRVYAAVDCCPPAATSAHHHAGHASDAHDGQAVHHPDGDEACSRIACALHCASAPAALTPFSPTPLWSAVALPPEHEALPLTGPPGRAPERPPRHDA